ncbi:hypothetical protein FS749_001693, partial [Ceratobasidium sp. UAMH 11750]
QLAPALDYCHPLALTPPPKLGHEHDPHGDPLVPAPLQLKLPAPDEPVPRPRAQDDWQRNVAR